jgi:ribosomal protein L6P/L9E
VLILINNKLNITLLKKKNTKYIIVYTQYYYIKYSLNNNINLYFNRNCNMLNLKFKMPILHENSAALNLVNQTLQIVSYFYKKILFSGKSYKIKKTNNNFLFEFNKSHKEVIIWRNFILKKLKKVYILLKGVNNYAITANYYNIINIRKINPFTLRGLRGSRYLLKKKTGKKSA